MLRNFLNTEHHLPALQPQLTNYLKEQRLAIKDFNFNVPHGEGRTLLEKKGITLPELTLTKTVAHPYSKVLQLCNYKFIKGLFPEGIPAVNTKSHDQGLNAVANIVYTTRDIPRFLAQKLPTNLDGIDTADLCFDDVLQYLTRDEVATYLDANPGIQNLYCTATINPATLYEGSSEFPALSTVEYDGDQTICCPDGDHANSYTQPLAARDWLIPTTIESSRTYYSTPIFSQYDHHVILITAQPTNLVPISYDHGDTFFLPRTMAPGMSLSERATNKTLVRKLMEFARRNPASSKSQLHAKMSQHMMSEMGKIDPIEGNNAVTYAIRMSHQADSNVMIYQYLNAIILFVTFGIIHGAINTAKGYWLRKSLKNDWNAIHPCVNIKPAHYTAYDHTEMDFLAALAPRKRNWLQPAWNEQTSTLIAKLLTAALLYVGPKAIVAHILMAIKLRTLEENLAAAARYTHLTTETTAYLFLACAIMKYLLNVPLSWPLTMAKRSLQILRRRYMPAKFNSTIAEYLLWRGTVGPTITMLVAQAFIVISGSFPGYFGFSLNQALMIQRNWHTYSGPILLLHLAYVYDLLLPAHQGMIRTKASNIMQEIAERFLECLPHMKTAAGWLAHATYQAWTLARNGMRNLEGPREFHPESTAEEAWGEFVQNLPPLPPSPASSIRNATPPPQPEAAQTANGVTNTQERAPTPTTELETQQEPELEAASEENEEPEEPQTGNTSDDSDDDELYREDPNPAATQILPIRYQCRREVHTSSTFGLGELINTGTNSNGSQIYWDTHGEQGTNPRTLYEHAFPPGTAKLRHLPDHGSDLILHEYREYPSPTLGNIAERYERLHMAHVTPILNNANIDEILGDVTLSTPREPAIYIAGPAGAAKSSAIRAAIEMIQEPQLILIVAPTNSLLDPWREGLANSHHTIHYGSQHAPARYEGRQYYLTIIDEAPTMHIGVVYRFSSCAMTSWAIGDVYQCGSVPDTTSGGIRNETDDYRPIRSLTLTYTASNTVPLDAMTYLVDRQLYPAEYQTRSRNEESMFHAIEPATRNFSAPPINHQAVRFSDRTEQMVRGWQNNLLSVNTVQGHRRENIWFYASYDDGMNTFAPRHVTVLLTRHSNRFVFNGNPGSTNRFLFGHHPRDVTDTMPILMPEANCVYQTIGDLLDTPAQEIYDRFRESGIEINHLQGLPHVSEINTVAAFFGIQLQAIEAPLAMDFDPALPLRQIHMGGNHISVAPTELEEAATGYVGGDIAPYVLPEGHYTGENAAVRYEATPNIPLTFDCNSVQGPQALGKLTSRRDYAKRYLQDLEEKWRPQHDDHTSLRSLKARVMNAAEERTVDVEIYVGLPGSGKSHSVNEAILSRNSLDEIRYSTPSEQLRQTTREHLQQLQQPGDGYYYPMHDRLLFQGAAETIILDEYNLLQPGYLDALILCHTTVEKLILIGDPSQGQPPRIAVSTKLRGLESYSTRLADSILNYQSETHRLAVGVAATLGLTTTSEQEGRFIPAYSAPVGMPLLAASPRYVSVLNELGVDAIAIKDVEGLTFAEDYAIDYNELTKDIDDHTAMSLLTRGRRNVYIVMPNSREITSRSHIMNLLIGHMNSEARVPGNRAAPRPTATVREMVFRHLIKALPQHIIDRSNIRHLGPIRYVGDSTNQLLGVQHHFLKDSMFTAKPKEPMKIHIPKRTMADKLTKYVFEQRLSKGERELVDKYGNLTDQISEKMTNQDMAPHHRTQDQATQNISLAARMKISTVEKNQAEYEASEERGERLFQAFLTATELPAHTLTEEEVEYSRLKADAVWLRDRTVTDLKRAAEASPPDADPLFARTFLKNQKVRKIAAINGPAKKGQIITAFPLGDIMREAPYAKFIEDYCVEHFPPHIYLHTGKNIQDTKEWYAKHWRTSETTASDYTAWDTGCDGAFLHFDLKVMKHLGVPEHIREKYLYRKLRTRMFMGTLTIMQLSGDRWTWLLNTLRNLALTQLRFKIDPNTPQAYSGDDMILQGRVRQNNRFNRREWKHTIKIERGRTGVFCGMLFGEEQLSVDARQLLARVQIATANPATPATTYRNYLMLAQDYYFVDTLEDEYANRALQEILSKYNPGHH